MTSPQGNELSKNGYPVIGGWERVVNLSGVEPTDYAWIKGTATIVLENFGGKDESDGWELSYWPDGLYGQCERSEEGAEDLLYEISKVWRREL